MTQLSIRGRTEARQRSITRASSLTIMHRVIVFVFDGLLVGADTTAAGVIGVVCSIVVTIMFSIFKETVLSNYI
jgi:uncharacterized membrane protein